MSKPYVMPCARALHPVPLLISNRAAREKDRMCWRVSRVVSVVLADPKKFASPRVWACCALTAALGASGLCLTLAAHGNACL